MLCILTVALCIANAARGENDGATEKEAAAMSDKKMASSLGQDNLAGEVL